LALPARVHIVLCSRFESAHPKSIYSRALKTKE
jgi:hypothetical protein